MSQPLFTLGRRVALATLLLAAAAVYLYNWQERATTLLLIGAGRADGEAFEVARAVADVVTRHHPRIRLEVLETQGSVENMALMARGQLDLATVQADTRTPPQARLVAPLFPDAFQLLAREESGIRRVSDLAGKTVALPPEGSGDQDLFWQIADHYGLTDETMRALPMSFEAASWALASGGVDAVFQARPAGARNIRQLLAAGDVRVVPIGQARAIQLNNPSIEPTTIPRGSYQGDPAVPPSDLETGSVSLVLAAAQSVDPRIVREITAVLFERRRELMETSPLTGLITTPDQVRGTFLPVHEGAQAYYNREEPSYLQENAELIALILSILVLGISSLLRLAGQRKRKRLEAYNAQLLALYREVQDSWDQEQVMARKNAMLRVLINVVDDAEAGRVTDEGFGVFALTWQAVDGALRDRLLLPHQEDSTS